MTAYQCTLDEFKQTFEKSRAGGGADIISEYQLVKADEHKSIFLGHATDLEAMGAKMNSPEAKQWDEENECVDTVYMIQKVE